MTTATTGDGAPSLTRLTSRAAFVNIIFGLATQSLALVQGIVVPHLLGPENMGLFALALGGVGIGEALKELGIPKKLVQERDVDLYTSYRVAFTLELMLAGVVLFLVIGVAPVLAWAYHRPQLWLLVSVLSFSLFSTAFLDLPAALPYREMRFVRRNVVQALGPVATFVVTVPLAFLGLGVWALALGSVAGFGAAAFAVLLIGPIKPGIAWNRPLAGRYLRYGWPLWAATIVTLAAGWGSVFVISSTIGVAGLGFFQLARGWASRALTLDTLLSDAVYPALCSIQGSTARLRRAFDITNQLSSVFASTVGFGMLLFGGPVVQLLLGPAWHEAILLVQAEGACVVLASVGFNWDTFLAARGETRPQLVVSLMGAGWTLLVLLPLLIFFGIPGAAAALAVLGLTANLVRSYYLRPLFGRISLVAVVWRQIAGCAVAAVIIGSLRALAGWDVHSVVGLVVQAGAFVALCGISALVTTRRQLLVALRSVRNRAGAAASPVVDVDLTAAGGGRRFFATARPMAFPMGVRFAHDSDSTTAWITTRDCPALGRLDVMTGGCRWTDLPPYPHIPTPDGIGGCWTALTRASAIAHVDAEGDVTIVPLPRTRELLGTTMAAGRVWAVDAHHRRLWMLPTDGGAPRPDASPVPIDLPAGMARPDIVVADALGRVWVGDTSAAVAAVIDDPASDQPHAGTIELPHPTRWLLPDADGHLWLGGSGRPVLTLVDGHGQPLQTIDLPGVPFDLARLPGGRVAAVLKDESAVAVVDPCTGLVDLVPLPQSSVPMGIAVAGHRCLVTLAVASEILAMPIDVLLPDPAPVAP